MPKPTPLASPWVKTGEPLLWFASSGRETRNDTRYFYESSKRDDRPHVTLQLTLSGEGFYENRRGRFMLPIGWAFFDTIPGPFRYGYPPGGKEPYELVFISLQGAVAQRWHKRITQSFGTVLNFGTANAVAPLMLAIHESHRQGSLTDRYLTSAKLYTLMMTVLSSLNESRVHTAPRVMKAISLMNRLAHDPDFNVHSLSSRLDCSREHLARQFFASTGVGPLEYLTQHRLRLAAKELRGCEDKLELIARRCGFSGANYLCRAFKKHVGTTPNEFRLKPWLAGP